MRVIRKPAYVSHRHFLSTKHHMQSNFDFNGKIERRPPPLRLSSADILQQLSHVKNSLQGKDPKYGAVKQNRGDEELNWPKKSIVYKLLYCIYKQLLHFLI